MKKLLLLLLISSICFGQESFIIKTQFETIYPKVFTDGNFTFEFDNKTKLLKMTDNDSSITKTSPVTFYNSGYSKDKKVYIVSFGTDLAKLDLSKENLFDIRNYTIMYDKKLGNVIMVKVVFDNFIGSELKMAKNDIWYWTEYGRAYMKENYD